MTDTPRPPVRELDTTGAPVHELDTRTENGAKSRSSVEFMDEKGAGTKGHVLSVRNLRVSYGSREVLSGIDVDLPAGALSAIVGPNGAGKSTMIKAALGLIPVTAGEVRFLGKPLSRVRRQIAYVPQQNAITADFPITAVGVVEMGRFPHLGWFGRFRAADDEAVARAMDRVGVTQLADQPFDELSGGQKQRVFLARALAQEAQILVLDEPFTAVDARTERTLLTLLRELCSDGHSVIAVHHELRTVRDRFDQAVLLSGKVIAAGAVDRVLTHELLEETYGIALTGHSTPRTGDTWSETPEIPRTAQPRHTVDRP